MTTKSKTTTIGLFNLHECSFVDQYCLWYKENYNTGLTREEVFIIYGCNN